MLNQLAIIVMTQSLPLGPGGTAAPDDTPRVWSESLLHAQVKQHLWKGEVYTAGPDWSI